MLQRIFKNLLQQRTNEHRAELYRKFLRHEAQIGGTLFGPIAPGARREFFCLDEHTWVWHEEWVDQMGQRQIKMVRYDIRPNGILKVQDGHYQEVSPSEAKHLYDAAKLYEQRVSREIYSYVS